MKAKFIYSSNTIVYSSTIIEGSYTLWFNFVFFFQIKFVVKQLTDDDTAITSPTPPTASIGETDFINQESHAVAQAFAEPEEACSEVKRKKSILILF